MAFAQVSATIGARHGGVLSADNIRPERHIVIETLRKAAAAMGLKPSVIATLDAMMSCLPPKRNHDTVFASNATLTFRRNGISERTIRRHVVILQDHGLMIRKDSPNRKRFTRHNRIEGTALRFGFDLAPFFQRFPEIAKLAAQYERDQDHIAFLRSKIRSAVNQALLRDPEDPTALSALRLLRRKLSCETCEELWRTFGMRTVEAEGTDDPNACTAEKMTASDGQNVRHHHKSIKEHIEVTEDDQKKCQDHSDPPLTVEHILQACPEAQHFATSPVRTLRDVIEHAQTLAPMIGIDKANYIAAQRSLGPLRAALTVWVVMQLQDKIRTVGAYFRAVTTGQKSGEFDPERVIHRLGRSRSAGNIHDLCIA